MKNVMFLSFMAFVFVFASCGPKTEGTDAEVSEAKEVQEVEATTTYTVATDASKVTWIGSKPSGKHNGHIPVTEGTIAVEGDKIVGGTIMLNVAEVANEDVEDAEMKAKLENHLKSADFFDVENHPTAKFVITSVEPYTGDEAVKVKEEYDTEYKPASAKEHMVASPTHKVTGNLTMRGKTLSISFPANVSMEGNQVNAKAKFNIDRTNWDVKYGDEANAVDKAKDQFIYNTVNVGFDLTAKASENM